MFYKKRILCAFLSLFLCLAVFAGCGKKSDTAVQTPDTPTAAAPTHAKDALSGTSWVLTDGSVKDGENDKALTGEEVKKVYGDLTYDFSEDNKVIITKDEVTQSDDNTYSIDDHKVTIKTHDAEMCGTVNGNAMTFTTESGTMVFTKL